MRFKFCAIFVKLGVLGAFNCRTIKNNNKKIADLLMFFVDFQYFIETKFCNSAYINLSWGLISCLKNVGTYRFSRIRVYWIQSNEHPDKQSLYKDLDIFFLF